MKILYREQTALSLADRTILANVRLKKTVFLLGAYLAINAILALAYMTGWMGGENISTEKMERYRRATTILTGTSFILITSFFIFYYFKTIYPYTRDLKKGLKTVSWFYPAAYKTPYFDSFFLKTGSRKKPMLAIPRELFYAIEPGVLACIFFAPSSRFVLSLNIDGRQVEFNEQNADLEL